MAGKARSKSSRPASFLRVAYSAPAPGAAIGDEIRRFTLPATKRLPFVKLRANDQPMVHPESFWHVHSTGKREKDIKIGRQYAQLAIAAMKADGNHSLIAMILQDIVKDAVNRTQRRNLGVQNPIALGFLSEISKTLAAAP